jgi:protein gp37
VPNESGIEWLVGDDGSKGLTVNPVIGCSRISPGCGGGYIRGPNDEQGGCWAEHLVSTRMSKNSKLPLYADLARPGGGWSGVVKLVPERLAEIVALGRRKKGARVFVCDMSDLFHDEVPFEFIAAVFGAMACALNHLFYILTKRPLRALAFAAWLAEQAKSEDSVWTVLLRELVERLESEPMIERIIEDGRARDGVPALEPWPLPNVAFGITCEDPRYGVPRLDLARTFPARWRWVSVEPQLADLGDVSFDGFDLIVNGGEAGPGSRPFAVRWARNIRDAADRARALFFMKQGGDFMIDEERIDVVDYRGRVLRSATKGHANVTFEEVELGAKILPHRMSTGKKGNDLIRLPEDLRIRRNLPMPGAAS